MKKTFLARRNALLSSTTGLSWGLVALACVLLLVLVRFVAPNFFLHLSTPFSTASSATNGKVRAFVAGFRNTSALAERNTQLVYENQALAFENQTLIARIEDMGKFADPALPEGVMAGVLARPPESPYDTLVLSSGLDDGIALGMRVFGPGGVPIGTISQVTADFSRVTLFSSPGVVTGGWVGETWVAERWRR
jgi:cell shape-determining protein MreC